MASKYRLVAKNIFLTYPQCSAPKAYCLEQLKKLFNKYEIKYIIVCEENHADDLGKHLHALVQLKRKPNFRNPRFADFSWTGEDKIRKSYHGDYKTAKHAYESMEYIKKDGNYLEEGDAPDTKNLKGRSKSLEVAQMVMDKKPILDIINSDPGFFMTQMKNILSFKQFLQMISPVDLISWSPVRTVLTCPARTIDFTLPEKEVATWLFTNIMQPRKHRQSQLYLYGPPACGKTSFYIVLLKFLRIFKIVYETDFLELYGDDYYDLMIFDEFKGQKKITFLNSLIDGTPKIYNVKFATVPKNKNLPAIFLSNLSPFEVYKGKAGDISLDAFVDRLQIVQVDTLYNLCNFFNSFLPTGPPPVELPVPVHLVEDPGLPDLPSTPTSPTVNL